VYIDLISVTATIRPVFPRLFFFLDPKTSVQVGFLFFLEMFWFWLLFFLKAFAYFNDTEKKKTKKPKNNSAFLRNA
jgi:hypothetical protein